MTSAVIPLKQFQGPSVEISEEVVIGKDILDLLTGAMYVDPLSIYREYVQNATDAIQEAKEAGLYDKGGVRPTVRIDIDHKNRGITIRDTGIGVPAKDFVRRLTALGASKKRGTSLRGFRGVGRLSGLGYCQEMIFRSRTAGERKASELSWDGRKLKDLLRSNHHATLSDAIRTIAQTRSISGSDYPDHFFEVELRGVRRLANDVLLNDNVVRSYIAEVGPVPFSEEFQYAETINEFLNRHGKCESVSITLGDKPILRPHRNFFPVTEKVSDEFSDILLLEFPGLEEGLDAVGWILSHSYLGAIPKRANIAGLRARVGNMQVGTSEIYEGLFSEARFNSWCVGEIHILSPRILPNGRRDEFEANAHLQNLQGHVAKVAKDLIKLCRDKSIIRNRLKSAAAIAESVSQSIGLLEKSQFSELKHHLSAYATRLVGQLELSAKSEALSSAEKAVIARRAQALSDHLQRATVSVRRGRDAFSRIAPAKRKAYEDAIDAVLSTSLPISVRAELAQKILRRATGK